MALLDEPSTYRAPDTDKPAGQADKAACTKRLFDSQEMPLANDFTQKEAKKQLS